jgi:CBS-domain-containing membrane protein
MRKPPLRLFDAKFRDHWPHYIGQALMAMVSMLVIMLLLDLVEQTVLIASLAASSFIAFSMPHVRHSRPRYLIGGYIVGAAVGCALALLEDLLVKIGVADPRTIEIACAAVALGLAFFLMVVSDTEHPPAAALALGFVLNQWDLFTLVVVMSGIVMMSVIKESSKSKLIDLL